MIFFYDWLNLFEELTTAEIGELILAAVQFDKTGEETIFEDRSLRVAFKAIKNSINISNERYQEICEKRRKAIEKRWGKADADTKEYKSIQINSNEQFESYTDTDTDTVTDTETETDTDTKSGSGSGIGEAACAAEPPQPPRSEADHAQDDQKRIIYEWNAQRCTQDIRGLIGRRKQNLAACGTTAEVLEVIRSLDQQSYLVQQANDGKPVTFDWFIQPDNFQKVAEGNYSETYGGEASDGKLKRNW